MNLRPAATLGALAIVTGAVIVACGGSDDTTEVQSGTVIQNATVVGTKDGSTATGMTLVIDGGKITRITGGAVRAAGLTLR